MNRMEEVAQMDSLRRMREASTTCAAELGALMTSLVHGSHHLHESADVDGEELDDHGADDSEDMHEEERPQQRPRINEPDSLLNLITNPDLPYGRFILAMLGQADKLRLEETCNAMRERVREPEHWQELDFRCLEKMNKFDQIKVCKVVATQEKYQSIETLHMDDLAASAQKASSVKGISALDKADNKTRRKSKTPNSGSLIRTLMLTLPTVKRLSIVRCYQACRGGKPVLTDTIIKECMTGLEHLECSAPAGLVNTIFKHCKQLTSLHITQGVSQEKWTSLQFEDVSSLRQLVLSHRVLSSGDLIHLLERSNLKVLVLCGVRFSAATALLEALPYMSNIEVLGIVDCLLEADIERGLLPRIREHCVNLRGLAITSRKMTAEALTEEMQQAYGHLPAEKRRYIRFECLEEEEEDWGTSDCSLAEDRLWVGNVHDKSMCSLLERLSRRGLGI